MFETFRNRNFSLLWFAGLISLMGNWILITALPFHVYQVTGSALATSAWLMAYILPGVLLSSVAGVFVDRWDRRKVMIIINLLQTALIPVLLLVQSPEWIWIVYVVGFLESALGQFFSPAESALLPTLVPEEQLVSANSLNALNDNLARIIGPAIGGVLLSVWGLSAIIVADSISYLLAAFLVTQVKAPAQVKETVAAVAGKAREQFAAVWQEWRAGLKLIAGHNMLRNTFIVLGIALFADAIISAILVVFVQDDMGLGSLEFGWLMTSRGVGGLIGGLLIAQFSKRFSTSQLIYGGLFLTGAGIMLSVFFPVLIVVLPLMAIVALPAMAWIIAAQTVLQQETADEYRGRVFGAFGTTSTILMLIGSGLAGVLADQLGSLILIGAAAVIYMISGVVAFALMGKSLPLPEPEPEVAAEPTQA